MSAAPAPAAPAEPAKKKGKLALIVVALVATAAGAATPMAVDVPALLGSKAKDEAKDGKKKKKHGHDEKLAVVPVGDVVVNLSEERMQRYLRIKLALQVEHDAESKVHEHVEKQKVAIKSWAISHISGKTLKDVSGPAGVNRLQREFLERVDDILYPSGDSPIRAVLFEEYLVQ